MFIGAPNSPTTIKVFYISGFLNYISILLYEALRIVQYFFIGIRGSYTVTNYY